MKEDFVSFDIAKKLEEKGFDCKTRYGYLPPMPVLLEAFCDTNWSAKNGYSAPTIAQALKWLREEKKIYIDIVSFPSCITNDMVEFKPIVSYGSDGLTMKQHESAKTSGEWGEAALDGIEYVLDNLIEEERL